MRKLSTKLLIEMKPYNKARDITIYTLTIYFDFPTQKNVILNDILVGIRHFDFLEVLRYTLSENEISIKLSAKTKFIVKYQEVVNRLLDLINSRHSVMELNLPI